MTVRALPGYADLRAAPELGPLAILDTALAVARAALLAENPELEEIGDSPRARAPPLTCQLAARLVDDADRMRDRIGRYRVALEDLRRARDSDDIPF